MVTISEQSCVKDQVPTTIELKETVCDQCEHGRTLERPTLEEIEVCRPKTERICANVAVKSQWKKWCRNVTFKDAVPAKIRN